MTTKTIDQKQNYSADFGSVFRSSAIFAVLPGATLTLSVMNYWKHKNGLEVAIMFSERDPDGRLVTRKSADFADRNVINYRPSITEGTVEFEAFGNRNMRIPYAAIMGIYETACSITMVHAYGRNHAMSEIENDTAITLARESCCTLRADPGVATKAYFHNGNVAIEAQSCRLLLHGEDGFKREVSVPLPAIAPYQSVEFDFDRLAPGFREDFGGRDGWATLHFVNHSAFPRLLVTWEESATGAIQVTHSNFDYAEYETDLIEAEKPALMILPDLSGRASERSVVIYPRFTPGDYRVTHGGRTEIVHGGATITAGGSGNDRFAFTRVDGQLPSRIVTAVAGRSAPGSLPFECSLGVVHEGRPPKRTHWAVVSAAVDCSIFLTRYEEIYDPIENFELHFRLFNANDVTIAERKLAFAQIADVPPSMPLSEIFPEARVALGNEPGYIIMVSPWGGFVLFTALAKGASLTIEHSF